MDNELRLLIRALYQKLGNKRYLHDLENLFTEKLTNLTGGEKQTIMYLVRDLNSMR